MKAAQDIANDIVQLIASTPARTINASFDVTDVPVGDVLASEVYVRSISTAAKSVRTQAAGQASTLTAQVSQQDLLAAFIAQAGTDLRDVSIAYYGTPDQWRALLQYNELPSSQLKAGTMVLVPKISNIDAGN